MWGFLCRTCVLQKIEYCCGVEKEIQPVINRENIIYTYGNNAVNTDPQSKNYVVVFKKR